jgi:predicted TIM-barrel fold metal-dependent hydrolase
MTDVSHEIISADSHVVEPHDLWQRLIEPRFRERAPRLVHEPRTDRLVCEDARLPPIGMLAGCARADDDVRSDGRWDEDVFPSGFDPEVRLADLALDGVDGEVLYPTLGMQLYPVRDPEFRWALFRAYNTWLAEVFCVAHPELFKGVAMLDPDDVDAAIVELERAAELGLAGVMLPLFSRDENPYFHPRFDRLWAAAVAHEMPVSLHAATTRDPEKGWEKTTPTEAITSNMGIQRVLLDMVLHGLFDRFTDLRVVSVENDAGWAGSLLERADHFWHRNRKMTDRWGDDQFCESLPSDAFRRSIRLTFMRDRAAILSLEVTGPEMLMWSSDFPHHVSTWPRSRAVIDEHLRDQSAELRSLLVCGNVSSLYGF